MGGRGTFASGKNVAFRWHTITEISGFKVLQMNDGETSKLPEESHSPNAQYVLFDEDTGVFKMLRIYNEDRLPVLEIALGTHQGKKALHWHRLDEGVESHNKKNKIQGVDWDWLYPGQPLYEQYKSLIEGEFHGFKKN